jgi:cytochrome P450
MADTTEAGTRTRAETEAEPVILPTGPRVDPYSMYAEMREQGAAHRVKEPNGLERRLLVTYEQARDAFVDPRLSKDPRRAWDELARAGYVKGARDTQEDYVFHLANTDPPDHTRLRKLIMKAFTMRRIEELRPHMREVAEELLDSMPTDGVDLVHGYAHPMSVRVICKLLGVPAENSGDFRTWATAMLTAPGVETPMTPQEGYARMHAFYTELLARKRTEVDLSAPTDAQPDILSALIVARDAENKLEEREMVALAMLLLSAGQEPTVNLIANGTLALLTHPDQLELLRSDPSLLPSAVEEFLRYDGPVELSTMRVAATDMEIAGMHIPEGSIVTVAIASADRDPEQFPDPDRLDITRQHNPHLAFGHGIHHCVGAPLARLEAQIAIGALIERFPSMRLGCSVDQLQWRPTRIMRGLVELPVVLTP